MRDRLGELGDAVVVVVTFAHQRSLANFRKRFVHPVTVVSDPGRAAYRAYGLGRGTLWQVWGFGTLRRYATLLRQGKRLTTPSRADDLRQLGGDFVIDASGVLVFCRPQTGPDDRPDPDELVAAVHTGRR